MFNQSRIKTLSQSMVIALAFTALGCAEPNTTAAVSSTAQIQSNKVSGAQQRPLLEVTQAKVRDLLPGRSMTAAYFTLKNNGTTAVTLNGAMSDAAKAVEMHTVKMVEDQMRMRPLPEVVIEAGQSATFVSGSHHLMLFGVAELNESMTITLQFSDGTLLPAEFSKVSL